MMRQWQFVFTVKENNLLYSTMLLFWPIQRCLGINAHWLKETNKIH
jgi:hypothetical protein